ncbi:prepilin-type N-terminal cleavage/methylation domain-containing protein [bacterium]|nr:prepilin-type N-terminal cleavage/methylation domain-containing protein [bacterium]
MEVRARYLSDRRGFSLVEVMLALMIGAVGLLALAGMLANVMRTNRAATDISIATALARQKIEQIKLTDYTQVHSQTESSLDQNGAATGGKFTRVTTVTENAAGYNTKTVSVAVFFSPSLSDTLKRAVITTIIYP